MNFISAEYAVLLVLTFVVAALVRGRAVTYVLLGSSIAFYGWWSPIYLLLLLAVIVLSWLGALIIDRWRTPLLLGVVVLGELSLLL